MSYLNISAYKFIALEQESLPSWQQQLRRWCEALHIKGTILLSHEGINLFLAGLPEAINEFKQNLSSTVFAELFYKDSMSAKLPYKRLHVKIKPEIITMGRAEVKPAEHTVEHLPPETFKQWYDEGKDMLVLDTRNDYEFRLGTFDQAIDLNIEHFRDFPEKVNQLAAQYKDKTIVMFCTGGIRCEKAGEYMRQQGFNRVYQLDGGIINYFAKCGSAHYHGECFVFDERVAVDGELNETAAILCFSCGNPLTVAEQTADEICPYCHKSRFGKCAAND